MLRPSLLLLTAMTACAQIPSVLNLSHDLVANGIAGSNMIPNTPTLDSRPLFKAGVAYAVKNKIATVTADRGSYYFLTQDNTAQHVLFSASNVNLDLQYSDLYFANGNAVGLFCNGCSGVTLQNFTMDYMHLPLTQVMVTAVNAANRTITYQTIAGWPAPSTLNSYATAAGNDYFLFVFRNGAELRQTGKLPVAVPFSGNTMQVTGTRVGSLAADLAAIQPGDTVAVTFRSGGGMLQFSPGSNNLLRNISIYSSADYGFNVAKVSNTVLDQLQVIARPGTDRLVSTSADGIHISLSGANNTISNSRVERTCDDAIVVDGEWYATVNAPNSGASVAVSLIQFVTLPVGLSLDFINISNASVIGTATIAAVSPAVAQQTATPGEVITLTLDHAIDGLQAGFGVIPSDASLRGGGTVVRGNLVHQTVAARGLYLPGVKNLIATDNLIDSTNLSGILIGEDDVTTYGFKTGPTSDLTIHNNIVMNAMEFGYPTQDSVSMAAAINAYVTNQNYGYVTTTPDSNFTITGNLIANTIWSGIRVESLNGGTISGNTILNSSQQPTDYITDTTSGETLQQLQADFLQPIVIARSVGVTNSNNTTTGSLVTSVSDASGSLRLAAGSIASAYGVNLASSTVINTSATLPTSLGGVTVTLTDNTGTAHQAPLFFVSSGQVNYLVPADMPPGVARVAIGAAVGGTLVGTVAPGLFSANGAGNGVAAALALRQASDGTQTAVPVFQCPNGACVSAAMDLGASSDLLVVEFYGTGIAGRSSLTNVVASANGIPLQVLYAGTQSQFPGLDQVNVIVPRSLAGAGEVPVILTVDGQTANVVTINIK
jgi:uncharacterized protein (TIGR03437 family)